MKRVIQWQFILFCNHHQYLFAKLFHCPMFPIYLAGTGCVLGLQWSPTQLNLCFFLPHLGVISLFVILIVCV